MVKQITFEYAYSNTLRSYQRLLDIVSQSVDDENVECYICSLENFIDNYNILCAHYAKVLKKRIIYNPIKYTLEWKKYNHLRKIIQDEFSEFLSSIAPQPVVEESSIKKAANVVVKGFAPDK